MITMTEAAANQIRKVQADSDASDKNLRLAVVGGGCSGSQYQLGFDDEYDGDMKVENFGVTMLVDANSMSSLDGIEIDYVEDLNGSTFVFNNPNATGGCGCGKSFSC